MKPPLALRAISPGGGEKLLPFMEFLPSPGGVPVGQGGHKIRKPLDFSRGF